MTSRRRPIDDRAIDPARSALMARVRQRHTTPELAVRRILRSLGIPYRLHQESLPGTPDICVPSRKIAIFVHGCFWHRHRLCSRATTPKVRAAFWRNKFAENIVRDVRNAAAVKKLGWKVVIIWECQSKETGRLTRRLQRLLSTALCELPIALSMPRWPVAIVTLKNRTLNPAATLFIECARAVTKRWADVDQSSAKFA
jgi:DNA mismatch endonuclease (patch repair protein)